MPNNFAQSPDGTLYITSGMDPVVRWDGLSTQAELAGIAAPIAAIVVAGSGTGTITGTYTAYVRYQDRNGKFSDLSPVSTSVTVTSVSTLTFSSLPISTDPKVTRRQILRNTTGQTTTYYVDIDTTDLTSTSLTSTRSDTSLAAQTAVPIFNADGTLYANRNGVPPNYKTCVASHQGRMFMAGEEDYSEGSIKTTFGSTTVTGVGTEWTSSLAGRSLYVVGADKSYSISSASESAQTLTLSSSFLGVTDNFALYSIRPARAERRLLYFSEAGLPESWPAINALSLQDDGDDITGLMAKDSFLYVLENRHIYRFTFQSDPASDAGIFLSAKRGCVNQRCWVIAESVAYMLDQGGIHAFMGTGESDAVSNDVADLFRFSESEYQVNWQAKKYFHAVHEPSLETIRWHVAFGGHYTPHHAICYNYRQKRWWIEEARAPLGAACLGNYLGRRQVFLGSDAKRILAFGKSSLDGPEVGAGTLRGSPTSVTTTTLVDSTATFASAGLVGSPIAITSGPGKGQVRRIAQVSGTTITVDWPWLETPTTASTYQIGGFAWRYKTPWYRIVQGEENSPHRVEALFKTLANANTMDMRVYQDFSATPLNWGTKYTSDDACGVASDLDDPNLICDLTKAGGFVQKRMDRHKEYYIDGPRFTAVELRGFSSREQVVIREMTIDGAVQ